MGTPGGECTSACSASDILGTEGTLAQSATRRFPALPRTRGTPGLPLCRSTFLRPPDALGRHRVAATPCTDPPPAAMTSIPLRVCDAVPSGLLGTTRPHLPAAPGVAVALPASRSLSETGYRNQRAIFREFQYGLGGIQRPPSMGSGPYMGSIR